MSFGIVIKSSARKVRRLGKGDVIGGFAGATADAFTLFERLEGKLEQYPGQLQRAAVELAKDWRTDRYLRRLEAMMIVADAGTTLVLTERATCSSPTATSWASARAACTRSPPRALLEQPLDAEAIARKAMEIAADICVYTNANLVIESLASRAEEMPGRPYTFTRVTPQDLPMIRAWLEEPHVRRWGDPAEQIALIAGDLDEPTMGCYLAAFEGRPFAYSAG